MVVTFVSYRLIQLNFFVYLLNFSITRYKYENIVIAPCNVISHRKSSREKTCSMIRSDQPCQIDLDIKAFDITAFTSAPCKKWSQERDCGLNPTADKTVSKKDGLSKSIRLSWMMMRDNYWIVLAFWRLWDDPAEPAIGLHWFGLKSLILYL